MKIRTTLVNVLAGLSLVMTSQPVRAHHAMVSQFNLDKPITLRGTVTTLVWHNPHGRIYVDVKNAEGLVENWMVETGATGRMIRRGLNRADFAVGVEVIVAGYAARDGNRSVAGVSVTFPDREASTPPREATFSLGR